MTTAQAADLLPDARHMLVTWRGSPKAHGLLSGERGLCVKEPPTAHLLADHLAGTRCVGIYPMIEQDGQWLAGWFCFDVDNAEHPDEAKSVAQRIVRAAQHFEVEVTLEGSKSKGYHLWVLLDRPVIAWKARAVATLILDHAGLHEYTAGKGDELRVYPKQDSLSPGQYGNFVYLPCFAVHSSKREQRLIHPSTMQPFKDQVAALRAVTINKATAIEDLVDANGLKAPVAPVSMTSQETTQAATTGDPEGEVLPRSDAGTVSDLSDEEFDILCRMLPTLRAIRDRAGTASYNDWLAGLCHLAPFADGRKRAHQISSLDEARYNQADTDAKFSQALLLYSNPARGGAASISERIVHSRRAGGREDVTPISYHYGIWKGCLVTRNWTQDKSAKTWQEMPPTLLTNFTLEVLAQEYATDGETVERLVRVRCRLSSGITLPESEIPTRDWRKIGVWLHEKWGTSPVIVTGRSNSDRVLEAVGLSGLEAPDIRVFRHSGWTQIDDTWAYITAEDIVGVKKDHPALDRVIVSMPAELRRYRLKTEETTDRITRAWELFERFSMAAETRVTAPIMGAILLAPLASFLPIDILMFLVGESQTRKSSLLGAALSFFGGPFDRLSMPATFRSTEKNLMQLAFEAKDLPLAIDNFVPDATGRANHDLVNMAHAMGDRAGRGRLNRSGGKVSTKPPRCLAIMTGEDALVGAGANNRIYTIAMAMDSVNNAVLREIQDAADRDELRPMMTGYINWLSGRLADPEFVPKIRARYMKEVRDAQASAPTGDGRVIEQDSWLRIGLLLGRSAHPMKKWTTVSEEQLMAGFDHQRRIRTWAQKGWSLASRFLNTVVSMMLSGDLVALDTYGGYHPTRRAGMLGWRETDDGKFTRTHDTARSGIVWQHHDVKAERWYLAIDMDACCEQIAKWTRTTSGRIVESPRSINAALVNAGLVTPSPDKHSGKKILVCGTSMRMVLVDGEAMVKYLGLDTSDDEETPSTE